MTDLISRQAAISLADSLKDDLPDDEQIADCVMAHNEGVLEYQTALSLLPSAQPDPHWIPCSERLPEHGGRYLISVLDGINRRTTVAPYLPRCKAWTMTGRMTYWKVIAWMPLPEPYQEEKHD